MNKGVFKVLFLFVALMSIGYNSFAAMVVVHEEVGLVNEQEFKQDTFRVKEEGWYYASMHDLQFSESLNTMSMSVNDTNGKSMGVYGDSFTFYALPGVYYLNVMASAGNTLGLGMYGVQIELLPPAVPLPPAVYLLSSALAMFVYYSRRSKKTKTNLLLAC